MKTEKKVIFLSVILGLFVWLIDTVLDYFIFYEETFWGLLISDIPEHEVYLRLVILGSFTIFGIIISGLLARRKQAEEKMARLNLVLRTIRNVNQFIVKEKNQDALIQKACELLIEGRGYHNAWIMLLDKQGKYLSSAEAGLGKNFAPIKKLLEEGRLTDCGNKALKKKEIFLIEDPWKECADCPLSANYAGRGAYSIRLEYNDNIYGLLAVSVPGSLIKDKEEQDLFRGLAGDISFALHNIELEKKRKKAEEVLAERIKELNCLYKISQLAAKPDVSLEELFKGAVETIPPSWQYPEITCARISFKDREFKSKNFELTGWRQSVNIATDGKAVGSVEVCYTEEKPEMGEGPFLKEEIALLQSITDILGAAITKKQAEEALRVERDNLHNIFESIEDGIYIVNQQYDIQYVNPVLVKDFGYYEGQKCYEYFHDRDEVCPWCKNQDVFAGKTVRWEWYSFKNERTYDLIDTPMTLSDGSIGKLEIFRDITEHKKLEDQLRQAQKMEAIGTLAGGVAHDFNNILTTIIGNASLALMNASKDDPLREGIEEIKIAGERAASLTRQLLAFSRRQIIQPEILDLNELLTDIEKMLGRLIGEDVELLTIPGPELWQVEADPGQMEQVIMNLVINARDAMPKGGKLTVETANVDLDGSYFRKHGIKEEQPGNYVMLAVSDTGVGMDKETQEHIFEPFFTTKEIGKGTGLGLSTVYGIVKQNNGFIWTYSDPGQGSTFKIYLPKAKGDVASEKKEQHPVTELGGSETVLIVEDDDSLRNLARKTLQQLGYRVLAAENGEEALRVSGAHKGPIELMITDVVMPKMGGKEIAERLQPLYPQMKVIYMSGYTDDAIAHHGVLAPGLNFLEKPFSPNVLARKVREVLDNLSIAKK